MSAVTLTVEASQAALLLEELAQLVEAGLDAAKLARVAHLQAKDLVAVRASGFRLAVEANELLLQLLAAARAGDFDRLIVEVERHRVLHGGGGAPMVAKAGVALQGASPAGRPADA